jgi:glycosyltransferase involved in cell wall biosynthesis
MRILLAHTYYKLPGGEDGVFAAESALLRQSGHEVVEYREHNRRIDGLSPISAAAKTVWNREAHASFSALLERERPDVCHFHNTFPIMSPAVFYAAKAQRIPVVVTLHNYRFLCPAATFLRDGKVCEQCLPSVFKWPAPLYGCYRESRPASAVTALMLGTHRMLGTWRRTVDAYIALTEFARAKFVRGGLPAGKVMVKPNFVSPDPGMSGEREDFALFVGRLMEEKGIATLLAAWRSLDIPMRLKIAGDGPLAGMVKEAATNDPRIEWLGTISSDQVRAQMKRARVLVFPSIWYEGLPLTVLEAYATGLPVIASDLGSMVELIGHGETGVRFKPGDARELAGWIGWSWSNRNSVEAMGRRARQRYEDNFTAGANYRRLMEVYVAALGEASRVRERSGLGLPERSCTSDSRWLWQRSKGRPL